ncbi:MAG: hypothetical protein JW808_09815, partial [Victivallales bacterium]|nr:hypothetical protein [Victivallales bacterium]
AAAQPLAPGKGGYLFTGDTNIVHSGWGIFYHVSDPYKYYTSAMGPADPRGRDNVLTNPDTGEKVGTRGPQTLLRAVFENAVIKATSKEEVDFVLRSPDYIGTIEKAVMLAVADADIGVTVESVWLNKPRTPPLAAAQAFLDVFDASNFSFSERERARAYAIKTANEGASEAVRMIADAEAYKTRVVSGIEADTKYFKAMLVEYRKNPDMVLVSRYSEVLGDVLKMTDDKFVIRTNKKGSQEVRLLLNREPPKKEEVKEE